jgi:hypothetical protein
VVVMDDARVVNGDNGWGESSAEVGNESRWWESNPRPDDYKSPALPLRHTGVVASRYCRARRGELVRGHGCRGQRVVHVTRHAPGVEEEILASRRSHWQAWPTMALTERDKSILDFEQSWWTRPEKKAVAIRRRFGITPSQYYRQLSELVDSGRALEHFPLLVRRLRRDRAQRRRGRYEGVAEQQHPRR